MTTTDTPDTTETEAYTGPAGPFARITGRLILPDGTPATGTTLTLDPLPCKVSARLADGPALIGSRVRTTLDEDGRVASKAGQFVDVIGCGEGVSPSGSWAYMVRLTGSGVDWRGVAILRAGTTTDLTDILAGLASPSEGGGLDRETVEAIRARLEELGVDVADVASMAADAISELGKRIDAVEAGAGSVDDAALRALGERLDAVEEKCVTSDDLDNVLDGGLYGSFPYVQRSQGKPAGQYGATSLSESFGVLAQTVIAADKDLHAVKSGPYSLPYVGSSGEPGEPQDYDLAGAISLIGSVFADLGGNIRTIASQAMSDELRGENGDLTRLEERLDGLAATDATYPYYRDNDGDGDKERLDFTREQWIEAVAKDVRDIAAIAESKATAVVNEQMPQHVGGLAEAYTQLEGQLAALEARLPREQTSWTKLTNLPANLVKAGDGNGVYVRRHGNIVYMAIRGADPAAGVVKFDVPDGYKHSFSMAAMGVMIPADAPKLAGKLQFGHNKGFEWKGTPGVTDLGYGVLSYPTNDPWPES